MASRAGNIAAFIQAAPPGELSNVVEDVKALAPDVGDFSSHRAAFQKFNEEQFTTVTLPGGSQEMIVSAYNNIGDHRYYDSESKSSFVFDHVTQKASDVQSYVHETQLADMVASLMKVLKSYTAEHYPECSLGVYPTEDDSEIALVIVANKYSPNNFWHSLPPTKAKRNANITRNGRWRSAYTVSPQNAAISGSIKADVHYYEDGNVRLLTTKPITLNPSSPSAAEIVRQIAVAEKKYQEDLNRAFSQLNDSAFKNLRRQLPVTRQKVEWDKISGYKVGQQIGGGRAR